MQKQGSMLKLYYRCICEAQITRKREDDLVIRTEDEVREGYTPQDGAPFVLGAKQLLKLDEPEANVQQGTGQIKTFKQLGFNEGKSKKPDGWYLPEDLARPAILLETKAEDENVWNDKHVNQIKEYMGIVASKYKNVVGILYNGVENRVFKLENETIEEVKDLAKTIQPKKYYLELFKKKNIDKDQIYKLTKEINDLLHFKFRMENYQDRMVFTAFALVVQKLSGKTGLETQKGQDYDIIHNFVASKLTNILKGKGVINKEIDAQVLLEEYHAVQVTTKNDIQAMDQFIDNIIKIANMFNSDQWCGEDVMAIFFNEFNRYRGKSQAGQVFTPEHIASLMYRLIEVDKTDHILDATCGSGTFLLRASNNILKEAGGYNTVEAEALKQNHIFGIELYRKIYCLACANMLIHKNGQIGIAQMDAQTDEAGKWIESKGITKVLMNPPYEQKYGCMKIVKNVLDHVKKGAKCAFLLPETKLDKDSGKKVLKEHTLTKIIKLPENLFANVNTKTSIFIFEAGKPQGDRKIKGYYIENDGLETVKNKGRQDVHDQWKAIEDYWIEAIRDDDDYKYNTKQLIDPKQRMSYKVPQKPLAIYKEDFSKSVMDYNLFLSGQDVTALKDRIGDKVLYDYNN